MTTVYDPKKWSDLTKDVLNFRGTGVSGTAIAGTSTNIDYCLTEDRVLTGAAMMCKNHVWGDNINIQVVDIDNILGYGANTVLNTFAGSWYMVEDQQYQPKAEPPYPAKIIQGLYIRLIYNSVGSQNVPVLINFNMHKILA